MRDRRKREQARHPIVKASAMPRAVQAGIAGHGRESRSGPCSASSATNTTLFGNAWTWF